MAYVGLRPLPDIQSTGLSVSKQPEPASQHTCLADCSWPNSAGHNQQTGQPQLAQWSAQPEYAPRDAVTKAACFPNEVLSPRDSVPFELYVVPRGGTAKRPRLMTLHMHIGPGDASEPAVTILTPNED